MTDKYFKLEGGESLSRPISPTIGEVYYITVLAYGEDANHRLTLAVTDGERVIRSFAYFVSAQKTEVYLPLVATGEERVATVSSEDGGVFYTTEPRIEKSPYEYNKTKTGTYLVPTDEWRDETVLARDENGLLKAPLSAGEVGRDRTLDTVIVGEYMYALCNGKMHVLKRSGDSFEWIYATERLGELRQMSVTEDGRGIVVTARNFGLFSFDISNPERPKVAAHIDSLEMATGLDIFGRYLFVADRTFGVDIIDISDIYNPVFISNIPTGETQDVCYSNGYVYAGVWAECKVRICDVRNPDRPREVFAINLSARGDGVFVKGGILYAATGQFPPNEHRDRYSAGYGLGNGLEIWDVKNPLKPERLSVLRGDGANYPGNPDLWRTYTSGDYLFFTNVYCGAYVYDVKNPASPRRLAKYQVVSPELKNTLWSERFIFPHERGVALEDNRKPYPIVDTYVDGDRLYLCTGMYGSGNNLYEVKLPFCANTPDGNDSSQDAMSDAYTCDYYKENHAEILGRDTQSYITNAQIRSVAVRGDYLYAAAGVRGIVILDRESLREIASVPTFDITRDVKEKDGYLYTAESSAGVAVYKIDEEDGARLHLVGQSAVANVVQIELSPDARYAVAHISNVQGLIDLRDKKCPRLYYFSKEFHMVYQYQISIGCVGDRYLIANATKGKIEIYDFGKGGSYEEPVITLVEDKTPITGMCADGEYLIFASGHRLYRIRPESIKIGTPITASAEEISVGGMLALPTVHQDIMFTTQRRLGKYAIFKLSEDGLSASMLQSFGFRGNPGMTVFSHGRYYLPLGYGGLVSFVI